MSLNFKENIGNIDRMVRLLIGALVVFIALSQFIALSPLWTFVFWAIGLILIATAITAY